MLTTPLAHRTENNVRLAVITGSSELFNLVSRCFPADAICSRFDSDLALAQAPASLYFGAILVDAACGWGRAIAARRVQNAGQVAPLIMFGVEDKAESMQEAFAAGADDVVLHPVNCQELYARTQIALLRTKNGLRAALPDQLEYHGYQLDRPTRTVTLQGQAITLTAREFAVIWLLFSRPGDYFSRAQLAEAIWGSTEELVGRSIEQHIYKLRKKLQLNGDTGAYLRTMYAHGYRIEPVASIPAKMASSQPWSGL